MGGDESFLRGDFQISGAASDSIDSTVHDLVDLLDLCHVSQDEQSGLTEVCRRVRTRLGGVAAAFVCVDGHGCHLLVADGGRIDLAIAGRAVTAAMLDGRAPVRGRISS